MKNPEYSELTYYNRSSSTIYKTCTVYTDTKIANNTNINQIMISFTDHYNAISIDRLPSKTKTGKESWYFNDSLACKTDFSSATKNYQKRQKPNIPQQVTGEYSTTQGNIRTSRLKGRLRSIYKKKKFKI